MPIPFHVDVLPSDSPSCVMMQSRSFPSLTSSGWIAVVSYSNRCGACKSFSKRCCFVSFTRALNAHQEHVSLAFGLSHFFRLQSCSKHVLASKVAEIERKAAVEAAKRSRKKRRREVADENTSAKRRATERSPGAAAQNLRITGTQTVFTKLISSKNRQFGTSIG